MESVEREHPDKFEIDEERERIVKEYESMCDPDGVSMEIKLRRVFEDENSLRHRRNRVESICEPLHYIYSDPPWIARQLAFTVYDQVKKLNGLIFDIENRFCKDHANNSQIIDIEGYTEELGEMISTDPRLCDLLELDFLMLIVRLLKSQEIPRIQAYAASILRPVVAFSRNKDDVGVVIQSITPVVLNLICSQVSLVRVKALWLLRNLVFKISTSSIEEFLAPVTSIILQNCDGFGVVRPAAEILLVVCQEHPKLSREKLNLVLPTLIKLIESNFMLLLTSGCWGLARLCDGRKEMVIEDKDLKHLIRRLVHITNWEERAAVNSGLVSLGSIARWGSDDVIKAIIQDKGSLNMFSILLEEDDMYIAKQVCWIISNITARNREQIMDVLIGGIDVPIGGIDCKFLYHLDKIVQDCKLADVAKEALWAITNVMCGLGFANRRWVWESCNYMAWVQRLPQFHSDKLLVLVFLEGLVNIRAVRVTWDGFDIDDNMLRLLFEIIVYDSDMFTKCGIDNAQEYDDRAILSPDDNAQESEDIVTYNLEFTFELWEPSCSGIRLRYYSLKKDFIIQLIN
ncbi:importin subunit alpha-8-like [Apium graveolens]|uniref:importin subunit alpha-8-like n=1 Tax=Apium graveolens TaxID=4045 RepID=UPI003D78FC6D